MKKILLSMVTVLAVGSMVAGATQAVFSATANIPGNSVGTGTLTIVVNKTAGKPWQVTNMKPGDVRPWEWMDIMNTGTIPASFDLSMTGVNDPALYLWGNLKIELRSAGSLDNDGGGGVVASTSPGGCEATHDSALIYNDYIASMGTIRTTDFTKWWGVGYKIPGGSAQRVCQRVYLDSGVGNDAQGQTVTFTESVYAEQ